jgi:hypothetical protein
MRPCILSALAITHPNVNPAAQPASIHCSHYSPAICDLAQACPAGLSKRSRRTFCNVPPTASCRRTSRRTSVSGRSIGANPSAYKRHPACPYDARLVQLSINACAGLDAGAFSAPHQSDNDEGKPACDIQSSASTARHPALVVPIQEQGRNMTCRFSPVDGSVLRDPSTACTVRSAGVDAGGTHVAFMGEGRDCFGRTTNSLEEVCVARWAARARPKEQHGFPVLSGR